MISKTLHPAEPVLHFWLKRLREPSFVYVIQAEGGGPFKIGLARDPLARLGTLQTGNPERLRLLYVLPGTQTLERELHSRAGRWTNFTPGGDEWFSDNEETRLLLLLIERASEVMVERYDGSDNLPTLPRFDERSPEQVKRDRRKIEQMLIDGWDREFVADQLGWRHTALDAELDRMKATGEYHCFFEEPDPATAPRRFAVLGYASRTGKSQAGKPLIRY